MTMRFSVILLIEAHALGAILAGTAARAMGYDLGGTYLIAWGWLCIGIIGGHIATKYGWLRAANAEIVEK